jgi:hypothetical protein
MGLPVPTKNVPQKFTIYWALLVKIICPLLCSPAILIESASFLFPSTFTKGCRNFSLARGDTLVGQLKLAGVVQKEAACGVVSSHRAFFARRRLSAARSAESCGMVKCEGGPQTCSTNKADMCWLLNRAESGSGGDANEKAADTVGAEPGLKMRKLCNDPVAPSAQSALHDWLRDAPMLYNLAAHAGSASGFASGSIGAHNTVVSSAGAVANCAQPGGAYMPRLVNERGNDSRAGAPIHARGRPPQVEQSRGESLLRTSSPDSQGSSSKGSSSSGGEKDGAGDPRRKSWSVSLDESLAIQIYASRPRNAGSKYGSMAEAVRLGERHGVSPKTIRDIWNRKSWVKVTRAFWTAAEASAYVPRRHRPSSPRRNGRAGSPKRRGRSVQDKAG